MSATPLDIFKETPAMFVATKTGIFKLTHEPPTLAK